METPARFTFSPDGNTKVFPIPVTMKGDNYVRIDIDGVILNDRTKFDLVNNAVVFVNISDVPSGSQLDVLVVQTDEGIANLGNVNSVDLVASNITDVLAVANSIASVNTTATNITSVNNVSTNMASVTDAVNQATAAAASAAAALGSENNAKASENAAAASASAANTYKTAAQTALVNAQAAELAAIQASSDADTAKNAAANSATAAAGSATAASGYADAGLLAMNTTIAAKNAAETAETNAAASATAAASSEAGVAADALAATNAASAAAASATSANNDKLAAQAAATSATNTAAALTGFDLEAIAASKAVTAVDLFVYDTSKDSDGGAWRKRTQHTSWYNETLNTATRGSRREFPAVAVIVAEASKVTIYDGDDPALPLWMVFNASTSKMPYRAVNSLSALNGVISTTGGSASGVSLISFVADDFTFIYPDGTYRYPFGSLSYRDTPQTFYNTGGAVIVSSTFNDVAMTVLPDAPIDPATGLPVPTIAVATNNGVSVIKDDGTVVDVVYSGSPVTTSIDATPDRLFFSATDGVVIASGYPSSDVSSLSFSTLAGLLPNGAGYSITSTPALLGTVSKVAA